MASHEEITDSLKAFVDGYNRNAQLKAMNRDWNRTVLIR
ncbi:MAG: sterol carrier protein, partial [Firmicutes bacterium]|nr:sterol carrier protein [Bacillota bacterium]